MTQILKKLNIYYYSIYIAAIIIAYFGYQLFNSGFRIEEKSSSGIVISSALIILIIGSIPLTLSLFNKNLKRINEEADMKIRLERYRKASQIRLAIIGSGFVLGIFLFFIMHSQSMIFCAGIAAIALFFCKPAEVKIISDLKIEDPDNL
jgi:MFS family permease